MPSSAITQRIRLDKFLANYTQYSRAEVKRLLKQNRVAIDKKITKDGSIKLLPLENSVTLDNNVIDSIGPLYIALHKPPNVECSATPTHHSSVYDIIHNLDNAEKLAPFLAKQLRIAGRLDADTTGLVLLTNDGQWNHKVTSPHKSCTKQYQVTLQKMITPEMVKTLESPIQLHNEAKPTQPARVKIISPTVIHLFINEGKYHQVKRMVAAVDNKVIDLHRLAIGDITLNIPTSCENSAHTSDDLPQGHWRFLTPQEIQCVERKA